MPALTDRIAADGRCLWLDYTAYAGGLLANGAVPWLEIDAVIGWLRKAQSLLKSDVLSLPVATVVAEWLRAHHELVAAMSAKRRTLHPLKTLLGDAGLRAHLVELGSGMRSSFPKLPLVLVLPSPRLWVAKAYAQALPGETAEIDADAVDGAAAYVADFLRGFAECGIDAVLLEETADTEPTSADDLQLYQAVFNVAAHYRWDAGLQMPLANYSANTGVRPGFVLAPRPVPGQSVGIVVPPGFWAGEAPPECPQGGFRFAEIPVDAKPESVLERLSAMR